MQDTVKPLTVMSFTVNLLENLSKKELQHESAAALFVESFLFYFFVSTAF